MWAFSSEKAAIKVERGIKKKGEYTVILIVTLSL